MKTRVGFRRICAVCIPLTIAMGTGTHVASGQEVHRIALSNLRYSAELPDTAVTKSRIADLVADLLAKAGFETVPATEVEQIRKRLIDSVGGYYSRLTGDIIEEKRRAVETGTMTELKDRFGAEAWLRPYLVMVTVDFQGGKARWDGTSEGVGPVGHGAVTALSLGGVLLRGYGDTIYVGKSGIQVLQKMKDDEMVPIPAGKVLSDKNRVERAAKALVDSIRVRLRPTGQ